jgi:ribosomal protein S18 acetylase RimI-like enzyme
MSNYKIRNVAESDLDRCFEIEQVSYDGNEAATREKIRKRIKKYPEGFIVLDLNGMVVGFINCGATDDVDLANEEFKDLIGHESNGKHIVIFSVVIDKDFQGKGFAGKLLADFIDRIKRMQKRSIHLICRDNLIEFYKKFGFEYIRESDSTHGGLNWHEMVLSL